MRLVPLFTLLLAVVFSPPAYSQQFRPGGPVDGSTRAIADLAKGQHMRNVGGSDGAGLCVFTSAEVANSRWQGGTLDGFQQWMTRKLGGGWPEKLDEMIVAFCREKKRDIPNYVQHTGGDEEFLELALKTGRMPCVTYCGQDDFYRWVVAHMVNLAYLDRERAAIIDNNRPGTWVWMSREDFLKRWRGNNGGWAVVFLDPPPPPYTASPTQYRVEQNCPGGRCPTPQTSGSAQVAGDEYLWLDGYGWAKVVPPTPEVKKEEPKVEPVKADPVGENHGVDTSKVHAGKKWYLNGSESDKGEAMRAIAGNGLADDTDRWFLIVVGTADVQAKATAAIAALDVATRSRLHVRCYAADSWAVGQFGLPAGVSIRKPAVGRIGKEAGQFAGDLTPDNLKRFVGDTLDGKPAPQPMPPPAPTPEPQPQPTPEPPAPTPSTPFGIPMWLLTAIAVAVTYFLTRRRN